ncbi:uncharacterized protein CDAR_49921 [Caerostris darwini]|uniref:Uncharacterized protein n=1 Tax=Caerostris darwini TaxID=1538125 RepID=A0AAV4UHY7_9ARAC|nr:uncharacterized protein CDAR_49921 [Caerostris darwini]
MLSKLKGDQTKSRSGLRRKLKLFSKMTRSQPVSPYQRMENEVKKIKVCNVAADEKIQDKENIASMGNNEVKEKKKKDWKRFRQAALTTCRYIGMGVAHMSPAGAYSSPDYNVDPKCWNRSFNSSYRPKNPPQPQTPHWTSNMMFSGW